MGCAKLQSNHHHQQTNTQSFFTGRMSFLSPNQQCQSTEGKISHSMDLLTPSSPGGLPTLSLTTNRHEILSETDLWISGPGSHHCWKSFGSGIFEQIFTVLGRAIQRMLLITWEVIHKFLWNFPGVWCLTGNKSFDFGADLGHNSHRGIFNGIFANLG